MFAVTQTPDSQALCPMYPSKGVITRNLSFLANSHRLPSTIWGSLLACSKPTKL